MNHGPNAESRDPTTPRLVNKWGPKFLAGYVTGLVAILIVGGAASYAIARLIGAKDIWEAVTGEELIFLGIGCGMALLFGGAVATVGPGTEHFSDLSVRRTALKLAGGGLILGLACVGLGAVIGLAFPATEEFKVARALFCFLGALLGPPAGLVLTYGSVLGIWDPQPRQPKK